MLPDIYFKISNGVSIKESQRVIDQIDSRKNETLIIDDCNNGS